MNKKMICYTLGRMLMLEGIMLGLPFMTGLIYQEKEVALIFGEVALVLLGIGYFLSHKRPLKTKIHAREGFLIVALAWTVLSLFGALPFYLSREIPSYIDAFFETVSGFTTTGYITADYGQWPMFSQAILFCLMFVGACAGSTGGGMKISRIMIVCKNAKKELKQLIHPHSVSTVKLEGEPLSANVLNSIHAYFIFYFLILFISFLIVSLDNLDFASSFSSVVTCLNNVGPGFNVVGPVGNFFSFSGLAKLVLSFDMLVGRLELFPFLVLFMKDMHC